MRDRDSIISGVGAAIFLHMVLVGFLLLTDTSPEAVAETDTNFGKAQVIEASLAFKEVKPKSKQPQKKKKKKFKPRVDDGASKKDKIEPKKDKKDKPLKVEEEEIDFNSILEKNRKQDEELSDTGSEEIPVEGSATGSEWGTEKDARGDPYVAELKGRISDEWKVPSLETEGGTAIGCVRLDEDGKIVDRELKKRSKNRNLARSVEVALKNASDMDKPVPAKLKTLLTVQGVCFKFSLD
ncbi:MAG: TonB C-terminal domain-containing protein [Kofleriaceae bacterium]|nr:TonB C-terminal domain-containing protein [Kofleriaceae bacterium]